MKGTDDMESWDDRARSPRVIWSPRSPRSPTSPTSPRIIYRVPVRGTTVSTCEGVHDIE
jgi:hypothetical protein